MRSRRRPPCVVWAGDRRVQQQGGVPMMWPSAKDRERDAANAERRAFEDRMAAQTDREQHDRVRETGPSCKLFGDALVKYLPELVANRGGTLVELTVVVVGRDAVE